MEMFYSEKDRVYNFIHKDGMQTSIKLQDSGQYTEDLDRENPKFEYKGKYSIVISSSIGCNIGCKFCHLTYSNKPYYFVHEVSRITNNVLEAVKFVSGKETLSDRYVKLCFMGEGEPLQKPYTLQNTVEDILSSIFYAGWAKGLDGVDVSSMMPKIKECYIYELVALNKMLEDKGCPLNPYNYNIDNKDRSIVRLFYSLHQASDSKRKEIIPVGRSIEESLKILNMINRMGVNTIIHYTFIEDVNDSEEDINGLLLLPRFERGFSSSEFRVLRYNGVFGYTESKKLDKIIPKLRQELKCKKFKVQYSAGEDVKAACGMFI